MTIYKYPNRRLYDTVDSKYTTLSEILCRLRSGASVTVLDYRTKNNITNDILKQCLSHVNVETSELIRLIRGV